MTKDEIKDIIGILERKYRSANYDNQYDRAYNEGRIYALADVKALMEHIQPMPLTGEILTAHGWQLIEGIYVLKSQPRLGWYEKQRQLIVGFSTFQGDIDTVQKLRSIMDLLNIQEGRP